MAVWLASWLFFAMIAFIGSGGIAPCLHCTLSAFLHTNAVRHFALDFESKLLARYNFSLLLPSSRLCERWLVVGFLYILFFEMSAADVLKLFALEIKICDSPYALSPHTQILKH